MGEAQRKTYTPAFKATGGLEPIRGVNTVNEIGQEYGVHPAQVGQWKKAILAQAGTLFEKPRGPKPVDGAVEPDRLYGKIGRLKMELDWLKKVRDEPVIARRAWIARDAALPLGWQCDLVGVVRSWVNAAVGEALDETDVLLDLMRPSGSSTYGERDFGRVCLNLGKPHRNIPYPCRPPLKAGNFSKSYVIEVYRGVQAELE